MKSIRKNLSKDIQVRIFRRDGWLCHLCGRPVIFAPAMKYLQQFMLASGHDGPLAYFDSRWRRDKSPLLDHLGAVIDHIHAHSRGGSVEYANLKTACNKCNMRKNDSALDDFGKISPKRAVNGRYGEPEHWDGLSALFTILVEQNIHSATVSELEWLRALKTPTKIGS